MNNIKKTIDEADSDRVSSDFQPHQFSFPLSKNYF